MLQIKGPDVSAYADVNVSEPAKWLSLVKDIIEQLDNCSLTIVVITTLAVLSRPLSTFAVCFVVGVIGLIRIVDSMQKRDEKNLK